MTHRAAIDVPPEGMDTPYGRLYRPPHMGWQVAVLFGAFVGGPTLGWLVGAVPGDLSESARTMVQVPFMLVFFVGYSVWVARLNALAFRVFGRGLLKVFLTLLIRKRLPQNAHDVLPTYEAMLQLAVDAQKAGASFGPVSWPIALFAGACALLFDSHMDAMLRFGLVAMSVIAWGYALAWLGRRGYLPFMEGE